MSEAKRRHAATLVITLPPRPRLVISVDPSRLSAAKRQVIEKLVIEWDVEDAIQEPQ